MANLLQWLPASFWTLWAVIAGLSTICGLITGIISRGLKPPVIQLELAESVDEANRILGQWGESGRRKARRAIIADFFFALFYPPACALLLMAMASNWYFQDVLPLGIGVAAAVLTCGIWDGLENVAMLMTLKRVRPTAVDAARWFARIKFGLLALGLSYVFFWCFYFGERMIADVAEAHPKTVSWVLVACIASIGTLLIKTEWKLKPSLLMLQLAPTRSAVNRLMVRWDESQHKTARRAILIDLFFVLLYTAVAALFFATAVRPGETSSWLRLLARIAGWSMVAAGALQWMQDWGAFYTLKVRRAGWWSQPTRVAGITRITLIKFAAGIGVVFFINWEQWHLRWQAAQLIQWIGKRF
jgi:hypothetical protein